MWSFHLPPLCLPVYCCRDDVQRSRCWVKHGGPALLSSRGRGCRPSLCRCVDTTAAWLHGAAKKPLAVQTERVFNFSLRRCVNLICWRLFCARSCSWAHRSANIFVQRVSSQLEGLSKSKSEIANKSVRVCWFKNKNTQIREILSSPGPPKKSKNASLLGFLIFNSLSVSLIGAVVFDEIK